MQAIDRLSVFLSMYYPMYTIRDVRLSAKPGYIEVLATQELICIQRIGYRTDKSINQLWNELHEHFDAHVKIVKKKNKVVTVIEWNNDYYALDNNRR